MQKLTILVLFAITFSCSPKKAEKPASEIKLTISSGIDQENELNQEIIGRLNKFLESKNDSYYQNKYWSEADFDTFIFPFIDIYNIEKKGTVTNYYQPTLLEIIDTDKETEKVIKIAFIGHDELKEESTLRCIYNLIASKTNDRIIFSNPLHYFTQTWPRIKKGSVQYVVSPLKEFNEEEADRQLKDIAGICEFYNTDPLSVTYYSCTGPEELFRIKGFDYTPNMYVSKSGGLASHRNIIFSANKAEFYTHEIVHLYNLALFPSIHQLFNEGMATYMGGSGIYPYQWHREKLGKYIEINEDTNLSEHMAPFGQFYIDNETPVPYMVGALICERTYRLYGRERLITLLQSEAELWETLHDVGLNKENLDRELKKELLLSPTLCIKT